MFRVVGTRLEAEAVETIEDKLLGYPLAGVHVGGGRHVAMPATWDGSGSVPIGWTSYKGSSRQHPTLAQFATPLDPECPAAMGNGRRSRLSAAEQSKMSADLAAAVPTLPSDWFPAGAQATKADDGGRT
jgi:hypothetical protein